MKRSRLAALAVGSALVLVACGAADDSDGGSADGTAGTVAGDTGDSDEPVELISPTDVDQPFDLTGGVSSSAEGLLDPNAEERSSLEGRLADATSPWPTNWALQTVELDEFQLGISAIDPRDRIPPVDTPQFEPIGAAVWLDDREPGALVRLDDEVRFYPLSILTRHEIINDRFGDVPVAVTYCPLCNTALAFDRRVDGQVLRFGVSGLLRKSDLVMWDDVTTSLWQQITGEGVVGEFAGTQLETISTSIVSYADARDSFPEALSLSRDTGFGIEYGANPYSGYSSSTSPFLFDGEPDPRFPALSRVVGVSIDETDKAYPFELIRASGAVNDQLGDTPIVVLWGGDTADALDSSSIADGDAIGTGVAYDRRVGDELLTFTADNENLFVDAETGSTWNLLGQAIDGPLADEELVNVPHRNEFWFAWAAFFPDAEVYGEP